MEEFLRLGAILASEQSERKVQQASRSKLQKLEKLPEPVMWSALPSFCPSHVRAELPESSSDLLDRIHQVRIQFENRVELYPCDSSYIHSLCVWCWLSCRITVESASFEVDRSK